MRSGFGYTAVVVGVVAVGLVLAVLSFAGGSSGNTDQEPSSVLLAAPPQAGASWGARPQVVATTTVLMNSSVSVGDRERFCLLADGYRRAVDSAYGVSGVRSDAERDWQKQLEFFSIGATLVDPAATDPVSGASWRNLLLAWSDHQAEMNLELVKVNWNLGAYPDTKSSSRVGEAPVRLILSVCDQHPPS